MYASPDWTDQSSLLDVIDNVKDVRTAEDLLFQALPAFRIPYSAKYETFDIEGKKVFNVNAGQLIACFDVDVNNDVIEAIARMKPSTLSCATSPSRTTPQSPTSRSSSRHAVPTPFAG